MRPRYQKVAYCGIVALLAAGCQTGRGPEPAAPKTAEQQTLGKLGFLWFEPFRTLNDLWRGIVEPFEETAYLQVFEKDGVEAAVCMVPQGGVGVNALIIYAYDDAGGHWCPRAYWDTGCRGSNEVIGVNMSLDHASGLLEARSGHGNSIFRANMAALAQSPSVRSLRDKPSRDYAVLRTLEELKAVAEQDGWIQVFEEGGSKVAVRVQLWGSVGWEGVVLYSFDETRNLWAPHAIWDTGARDVRVTFDKPRGTIRVRSGTGALIFQTTVAALKPRKVPWDW